MRWEDDKALRDTVSMYNTHFNLYYDRYKKYDRMKVMMLCNGYVGVKEILCILGNISRAINYNAKGINIPLHKNSFTGNTQRISYDRFHSLLYKMQDDGYIDIHLGGMDWKIGREKIVTCITFNEKIYEFFKGFDVSKSVDDKHCFSAIEIKDRATKKLRSNKGFRGIAELRKNIDEMNCVLSGTVIQFHDCVLPTQVYKRVFIDTLDKGGRIYNASGGVQTMSQEDRKELLIDGEEVVELDFKALHPSILYELQYQRDCTLIDEWLSDNKGYDPYNVDNDVIQVDENKVQWFRDTYNKPNYNPLRNMIKHIVLVGINSNGIRSCYTQLAQEIYADMQLWDDVECREDSKFYGIVVDKRFPALAACEMVLTHNYPIATSFFSDQGVHLQFVDSEIMSYVITALTLEGEACLPVHDSVVVRKSLEQKVTLLMREAYKHVIGSDVFCNVEAK